METKWDIVCVFGNLIEPITVEKTFNTDLVLQVMYSDEGSRLSIAKACF